MEDRESRRHAERGFALILAILSLMLLTFLGLTLATTTSSLDMLTGSPLHTPYYRELWLACSASLASLFRVSSRR